MNVNLDQDTPPEDLASQTFFCDRPQPVVYRLKPAEIENISFRFLLLAETDSNAPEMSKEEAFGLVGDIQEGLEKEMNNGRKRWNPEQLFFADRMVKEDDILIENLLGLEISPTPGQAAQVPTENSIESKPDQLKQDIPETGSDSSTKDTPSLGDPGTLRDEAARFTEDFQVEFNNEMSKLRARNPEQMFFVDRMLEAEDRALEGSLDLLISPEDQEEAQEIMEDVCKDAFKATFKQSEEYNEFREDMIELGEGLLDRFGIGSGQRTESSNAGSSTSTSESRNGNFLGAREIDTGLNTRIGSDLRVSAYVALEEIRALRTDFDAKVELGNTKFKVALEKTISDQIFGRFNFQFKDYENFRNFADTKTLVGLNLSGVFKNGKWIVNVGYINDNTDSRGNDGQEGYYAGLGFVIRN